MTGLSERDARGVAPVARSGESEPARRTDTDPRAEFVVGMIDADVRQRLGPLPGRRIGFIHRALCTADTHDAVKAIDWRWPECPAPAPFNWRSIREVAL